MGLPFKEIIICDDEEIMDYDDYYEFAVVGTNELYEAADTLRSKTLTEDGWYNFYLQVSKFENKSKLVFVVHDFDIEDDCELYALYTDGRLAMYEKFIEIAENA